MIEATRRWFRRNRTWLAAGAGAVGLGYLAGQYAWSKWLEARQRMSEERISKENLRRRFEQNQEDCTYTVLALLPTIRDEVIGAMPVEEISNELQKQRAERLSRSAGGLSEVASTDLPSGPPSVLDDDKASMSSFQTGSFVHASQMGESSITGSDGKPRPKRSKAQLWHEMKIQSIARALTLLYTISLLTLLTRIQLNLLGRRTYLSSVVSLASPPPAEQASTISLQNNDDDNYDNVYGNDFETNRKYLTFSWWLLHRGCKDITERVTAAVKEVFGSINPREDISLERLSELILEVRKKVEGATETERKEHKWLPYLLPPKDEEAAVLREHSAAASPGSQSGQNEGENPLEKAKYADDLANNASLRRLLDETSDLIDSPTFTHVLTLILNSCFSHLIDTRIASEAFKVARSTDPAARIQDISDRKVKVAQTLAVFCRQAHVIAAGSGEADELNVAEGGVMNEYLASIDQVKDLEAFAAVIYSSNFEFETIQQEPLDDPRPAASTSTSTQTTAAITGENESAAPFARAAETVQDAVGMGSGEGSSFESAWKKATASDDGKAADDQQIS